LLELNKINKDYVIRKDKVQPVLKDLDVSFPSEGFVSILGTSGSGKTTLLNIIGGLDMADSGTISYNGRAIDDYDQFRRDRIGIVFQDHNLIDHLNAVDNVILSMTDENKNKKKTAKKILKQLGLENELYKKPNQLSGGQKQRIAIARMIAKDVDIIICDEPTGSLDEETGLLIVDIIKELSLSKLVIFVTHNQNIAAKYSDEIMEMDDGSISKIDFPRKNKDISHINKKSYNTNMMWLAFRNIFGRKKHTIKTISVISFIMLLTAIAIIMEGEFFKRYIHENAVEDGIRTIVLNINNEDDFDEIVDDYGELEYVTHAGDGYHRTFDLAASNYVDTRKETSISLENIDGNDYFKTVLAAGRMPETSDEVLMTGHGAIALLRDLGIGGERLYDQYMTGEMSEEYVYDLIDNRKWIVAEYGNPRIKIVGIIKDNKAYEEDYKVYVLDGFIDLFEYPGGLHASKVVLYKEGLYVEEHNAILSQLEGDDRVTLDQEHERRTRVIYNKMHSFLKLSKISLYIIIGIAVVSLISLLFSSMLERKYEIGLYRSKGYNERNITQILGTEMFSIGFISIGIVIGCLIITSVVAMNYVDYLESYQDVLTSFNMMNIIGGLGIMLSFFIGMIVYMSNRLILKQSILSNIRDI